MADPKKTVLSENTIVLVETGSFRQMTFKEIVTAAERAGLRPLTEEETRHQMQQWSLEREDPPISLFCEPRHEEDVSNNR